MKTLIRNIATSDVVAIRALAKKVWGTKAPGFRTLAKTTTQIGWVGKVAVMESTQECIIGFLLAKVEYGHVRVLWCTVEPKVGWDALYSLLTVLHKEYSDFEISIRVPNVEAKWNFLIHLRDTVGAIDAKGALDDEYPDFFNVKFRWPKSGPADRRKPDTKKVVVGTGGDS